MFLVFDVWVSRRAERPLVWPARNICRWSRASVSPATCSSSAASSSGVSACVFWAPGARRRDLETNRGAVVLFGWPKPKENGQGKTATGGKPRRMNMCLRMSIVFVSVLSALVRFPWFPNFLEAVGPRLDAIWRWHVRPIAVATGFWARQKFVL